VIRVQDDRAHYAGLVTCGSIWECPVCEAKIRQARAVEVGEAAARWDQAGRGCYMITLTVPHSAGMSLDRMWSDMTKAMQKCRAGKAYQQLKNRLGIAATATAKETTHGPSGWHPHLHTLVFTTEPCSAEGIAALTLHFSRYWTRAVVGAGYGLPSPVHGVRVDACRSADDAAQYLVKTQDGWNVGSELARGDLKSAQPEHRLPFEILADIERYGLAEDVALWREYEATMPGKRAIVWSRYYREVLGMTATEMTDEELAAAEVGGETIAVLSPDCWDGIWTAGLDTAVLEAAEAGGLDAINLLLHRHHIPLATPHEPQCDSFSSRLGAR